MTKEETIEITSPFHDLFYAIIQESWDEWLAVKEFRATKNFGPTMYKRTITNYVFDAIARRAIPAFQGKSNVSIKNESQTFKLLFGGVCARFKKGDENNLSMNVPTFAAIAFENANEVIPGLPPEITKVDVIWRPNELWTEIEQVLLVSRNGDEIVWDYQIETPAAKMDGSIFKFDSVENDDLVEQKLIKPKVVPIEISEKE